MKCEEFEAIGLGLEHQGSVRSAERAAAMQHVNTCARCAALQESWEEARVSLQSLREATQHAETPARVEMRLRQEFRTKHRTSTARGKLIFATWTLATATVLIMFASWWNWRLTHAGVQRTTVASRTNSGPATGSATGTPMNTEDSTSQATLVADNEGDFTLLPGSLPQETQDAAIFRVRMQRSALGALGLPVNEERAADWIQVDLLVGEDGQPRAVRLPAETMSP